VGRSLPGRSRVAVVLIAVAASLALGSARASGKPATPARAAACSTSCHLKVVASQSGGSVVLCVQGCSNFQETDACKPTCIDTNRTKGIQITLKAQPPSGFLFGGWSGGPCSGTGSCTFTLNDNYTITATWQYPLLSVAKDGSGTVTSSPGGIQCGATCSGRFAPLGSTVTLTGTPDVGWALDHWEGACSGSTPTCSVKLDTDGKSVKAVFAITRVDLNVATTAHGHVTSSPAGIDCGATCTAKYTYGTAITLTAVPDPDATLLAWSGGCAGRDPTCSVTVKGPTTVQATFGAVSIAKAVLKARYRRSRLTGSLTVVGEASQEARLLVTLTPRPGGKPAVSTTLILVKGPFTSRLTLPRLLLPGLYTLRFQATILGVGLPVKAEPLHIPAPRTGVVTRAYISPTAHGSPATSLPLTTRVLYAHFHFAPGALSQLPLTVKWFGPRITFVGKKPKLSSAVVESFVAFPANYPNAKKHGIWRCVLSAGGAPVAEADVKLG
jgi:hypothetical protein